MNVDRPNEICDYQDIDWEGWEPDHDPEMDFWVMDLVSLEEDLGGGAK